MVRNLTIEREKWGRGTLCDDYGSLCCLGFYGLALGVPKKDMLNHGVPGQVACYRHQPEAAWLLDGDGDPAVVGASHPVLAQKLMTANDDLSLSQGERESKIKAGFALAGITVTFV
jgi:hypothetical protein